jgi:hypothetical protein
MNVVTSLLHFSLQIRQEFPESPHGRMGTATPAGIWDYIIVIISGITVLVSLYLCIKYFLRPEEKEDDHIKRRILNDDIVMNQDRSHDRER